MRPLLRLPWLVESKDETRQRDLVGGVTGKGFVPGQSGNPGGRPKGFARRVKEEFGHDGAALAHERPFLSALCALDRRPSLAARRRPLGVPS